MRGRARALRAAPLLAAVSGWLVAGQALAHPLVEEGRERMQLAEFDAALEAFARAEDADDLSRDDLIDLLDARAMVHLATSSREEMDRDLSALSSLDPDHLFGPEAPPELSDAFADVVASSVGSLTVRGSARPVPGGIELSASVEHDTANLTRGTRIWIRQGSGSWRRASERLVTLPAGGTVDYYVEAIGPGGALIARGGSRAEPLHSEAAPGDSAAPIRSDGEGGGVGIWLWLGLGAVVIAGGVVAAVLLFGGDGGGGGTEPNAPVVIGF